MDSTRLLAVSGSQFLSSLIERGLVSSLIGRGLDICLSRRDNPLIEEKESKLDSFDKMFSNICITLYVDNYYTKVWNVERRQIRFAFGPQNSNI